MGKRDLGQPGDGSVTCMGADGLEPSASSVSERCDFAEDSEFAALTWVLLMCGSAA
jgi:hypothetical protein